MDSDLLLVLVVVAAVAFDLMNGFHDGCNAVSTVIYTKALKPRTAIFMSACFNFIGPFLGIKVAQTIGGVIDFSDATRVMGIITLFLAARYNWTDLHVPVWVILLCAGAMAVGTYLSVMSFRLIRTIGEGITKLHPVHGFSAETGAAAIIFTASRLGLPVSTTHVVTSSVTGTGMA